MKIYKGSNVISVFSAVLMIIFGTSCNDFLDMEPLDQVAPEQYFKTPEQLQSFTINMYYSVFMGHSNGSGCGMGAWDNGTDNQASSSAPITKFTKDRWKVPSSGGIGFGNIRNMNWFINQVQERLKTGQIVGKIDDINQCLGEAYAIRALLYFSKLKTFGDFPIQTDPLPDDENILREASKRMPRNEVARFILSDLDKAEDLVKKVIKGNQRITKAVVQLIKSNVALYEGTFEKYHKGSGRVPGDKKWPGLNKEWNKNKTFDIDAEVNFFLTKAAQEAKKVGQSTPWITKNSHIMNPKSAEDYAGWNSYFDMFSTADLSRFPEILLWRQYSVSEKVTHRVPGSLASGAGTGWTRSLVNCFLTKNGLPFYADDTYKGDKSIDDVKDGRDERLGLFIFGNSDKIMKKPRGKYYYELQNFGAPVFVGNSYTPTDVTGYRPRKYYSYNPQEQGKYSNSENGAPIFRVAEAYLNYIEASYELTGEIDVTADEYWRRLRIRAGVNPNYMKTIASTDMTVEGNVDTSWYDWGAFSNGEVVSSTLYNIRRERRCEFAGEGLRAADLVRWRSLDQVKEYQIEGVNFWDKLYSDGYKVYKDSSYKRIKTDGSSRSNMSSKTLSKYVRPFQIVKNNNEAYEGLTFYQGHYLSPFSEREMQLCSPTGNASDSYLYQNPGWEPKANTEVLY